MRGLVPRLSPRAEQEHLACPGGKLSPSRQPWARRRRKGVDRLLAISEGPLERPPLPRGSTLFEQVLREIREEEEQNAQDENNVIAKDKVLPLWRKGTAFPSADSPGRRAMTPRRLVQSFRLPASSPRPAWSVRSSPSPRSSPRHPTTPPPDRRAMTVSPTTKVSS